MDSRAIQIVLIADQENAAAREAQAQVCALMDGQAVEILPIQRVRGILPGIRATPAVGVMFWCSDLQGLAADVEAFAAYIKGEAAVKDAVHTAQRYLPDEVILAQPRLLVEPWSGEGAVYAAGDIRARGADLYRCLTAHTSQAAWTPEATPSLWARIADPAQEWPEWIAPTMAENAYAKGDRVRHGGKHWVSDVDGNVWEPGVSGWTEAA